MYIVYVLKSRKDSRLYTGFTNDLQRRLSEHNKGKKSTQSTINRGPFDVIYSETAENSVIAREKEKYLKSGKGREFLKRYIPK